MTINYQCLHELENQNLFENNDHRNRFSELMNCYCNYPFFNKGLCKCMYLSSWDMEHFVVILDILNNMTLERERDVEEMKDNGKVLEVDATGYDRDIFRLAGSFLEDTPFDMPAEPIPAEGMHIIERALMAAAVIDHIFSQEQ